MKKQIFKGGRLENKDWFENEDELDTTIFNIYNDSDVFHPSITTIRHVISGNLSVLMSRLFVLKQHSLEPKVHGLFLDVFSNSVEIICEKGTIFFTYLFRFFFNYERIAI